MDWDRWSNENNPLIQIGTTSVQRKGTGYSSYYVWYELIPPMREYNAEFQVSADDVMQASIKLVGTDRWQMNITDLTTGQSFNLTVPFVSKGYPADWILEKQVQGEFISSPIPSDYKLNPFSNISTTINGTSENFCSKSGSFGEQHNRQSAKHRSARRRF